MKKMKFKRIVAVMLFMAMMLGIFPPIELNFGDGIKLNLGDLGGGLSLPVSAAGTLPTSVTGLTASWTDASNEKGKASWSASENTITGTAKGYTQYVIAKKSVTTKLTLTNNLGSEAKLEFTYSLSGGGSVSGISGNSYSGTLSNGSSLVITLTSPSGSEQNTLTISGIKLTSTATGNVTTTFKPPENGSYTVNGQTISAETDISKAAAESYTVVATPASGYQFFGWYNETTGVYLSYFAEASLPLLVNATVRPVFIVNGFALFGVGSTQYYDLNEANTAAKNGSTKTIILLNNGKLPAGDYEISSGVTLLIPRDDSGTVNESTPERIGSNTYASNPPKVFRTLTMASGASITVDGKLCVNAMQSADQAYAGHVTGPYGCINMSQGSTITMNGGSTLYAWGYIIGSGSVVANSGSTVYENFQLTDFRGGNGTMEMADNKNKVFPMSQYYIQNIEVPLTINAGASVRGSMSVDISAAGGIQGADVPVIGDSGAMFKINSGYIVKDYIEGTGRLNFTIAGNVDITSISMSMKLGFMGDTTIDSSKYNLPIPGHMTVNAVSGHMNINQDLALFPGAELYVGEAVTCKIVSEKKIIVYDLDQWGTYCRHNNVRWVALPYVPGGGGTTGREKDALVQIDGFVDASDGFVYVTTGGANVYTTGTGRVITIPGAETVTHQVIKQTNSTFSCTIDYTSIEIIPAKLKNADGSYTETAGANNATTYSYCTTHGRWYAGSECNVTYVWSQDNTSCTATTTCGVAAISTKVTSTTTATCTAAGTTTYTATFSVSWADTQTNTVDTPALDHTYSTEWKSNSSHHWHECECGEKSDVTAHTPAADDGDCTTAILCTECDAVTTAAKTHVDGDDKNHVCDNDGCNVDNVDGGHTPAADDGDCTTAILCTECDAVTTAAKTHVDGDDKNHVCDNDGCNVDNVDGGCHDLNTDGNHKCDECGTDNVTTCGDSGKDHVCDTDSACTVYNTGNNAHADGDDKNHVCDYCQGAVEGDVCVDTDKDHKCDECEIVLSECTDGDDADHKCDHCGKDGITEHVYGTEWKNDETNHWHECACGEKSEVTAHSDETTKDHKCDTCGYVMSKCSDSDDADHKCDHCGKDGITEHVYGTEWKNDETNHWHECACGAKSDVSEHKYDDEFDADCNVCEHEREDATPVIATVNGVKYASLAEAIANAEAGQVIVLEQDTAGAGVVINKSITIDFNGHTYTINSPVGSGGTETLGFQILKGNTVTIKNGTLTANSGTNAQGKVTKVLIMNYANLNVEDMKLIGNENILYCLSINSGDVKITNSTITAANGKVAFDACQYSNYAIPTVTVENSAVTGIVEITGGNANIVSGTYNTKFDVSSGSLTVRGGSFTENVTEYCVDGFHTVDADNNGVYTYDEHIYTSVATDPTCTEKGYTTHTCACGDNYVDNYVAANGHKYDDEFDADCNVCEHEREDAKKLVVMIGEDKYDSLAAALDAAKNGDVIKLMDDTTLTEAIVVSGKSITIEGNHTINTTVTDLFTVKNGGELTLKDVTINSNTSILWATEGGKINVDGATLVATNSPYPIAFANENGEINIESGKISASGTNVVTISASGATINIKGGEVLSGNSSTVVAKDNATVNISGGTVKTETQNFAAAYAIRGAIINVSDDAQLIGGDGCYTLIAAKDGIVNVSGGYVNNGVLAHESANATATISGGIIGSNVATNNGASLTVSGGKFKMNVTEYCDDKHHTVKVGEYYEYGEHNFVDGVCEGGCGATNHVSVTAPEEIAGMYTVAGKKVTLHNDITVVYRVGYLNVDGKYIAADIQSNGDGSHTFTVPEDVTAVVIVMLGDINGDGVLSIADCARLNASVNGKITLDEQTKLACDINGDGNVTKDDVTYLQSTLLGKTTLKWLQI